MTAVAIVGMACRFAGAPDLASFWTLLREGRSAFGPVPPDRWDAATFHSASARDFDRTTAPAGAFLDDVRSFPALAFGIPPRRVEVMDPQQRFALEVSVEAIEDAGLRPSEMPRSTGVYVGITAHEFRLLHGARVTAMMMASGAFGTPPEHAQELADAVARIVPPRPFSAPGVLGNMCAAAVAQELDLHGPAYTVDAACASALVAVANAVTQLRTGLVDMALAGGAYLQLNPEHYVAFSRIGAMSNQGVCRPFDAEADGFVQGDGVGMLVLKRLDDAMRDGDRVYAVIEGVALNNDGRGDGPMAPVREGQVEVIRAAWKDAGRSPASVRHVEAHGTGTEVGDRTEVEGLREAFPGAKRVALGSAKGNIGHTMSAAGVAGLIKAALAIHHRIVPPVAGFQAAKPELGLGPDFHVPQRAEAWSDPERTTGVSSFGFGGTNGHAVLSAAPAVARPAAQPELVLLSAPDLPRLRTLCARTASALRDDVDATVAGVARAWARRRRQPARAGIVASTRDELLAALDAIGAGVEAPRGAHVGTATEAPPRLAFLFPGQGAQRVGMLRDLARRFPIVQRVIEAQEAALSQELAVPLTQLIWPHTRPVAVSEAQAVRELTATEHCQPAMLAAGLALDALLASVGVRPQVVTGHSLGEFAAAAVAGVISHEDAARFVARRGRAMAALPGDPGAMVAIMASEGEVAALLEPGAVIANVNHARQIVVSGTTEAVRSVTARAEALGLRCKALDVSHAFHSPILAPIDSAAFLADTPLHAPAIPVASGIADHPYADAAEARAVFLRHATSPVVFTGALDQCVAQGADGFLQVGAGGPLASFARGVSGSVRGVWTLAPLDDQDGGFGLLDTLAQLWIAGVDVDVRAITAPAPLAVLPPSVLPRETYWVVKDVVTRSLQLEGASRRASPAPEALAAPEPAAEVAPAPEPEGDGILEGVLAVVSKVSAYPIASLKPSMRLTEDLGFDSLMVGDLAKGLSERFPGLPGIPQELLINAPSVADLADFVRTGQVAVDDHDDDAPLRAFRPTWVPAPWPDLPLHPIPTASVVVSGASPEAAALAADLLRASGWSAQACTPDAVAQHAVGLLVWVGPERVTSLAAALAGEPSPDQAGPLLRSLAALARLGVRPNVVALSRADDPWSAGVAGALRALAREWPEARIKHVEGEDLPALLATIPTELQSADRSVDVRWIRGKRHGLALSPVTEAPAAAPGPDDVVAITGGTRGIGLQLGLRLASLGARVLLLGRRPPEAADEATVRAFPNVTVITVDALHRASMHDALAGRGVTVLVHAAGTLADGPVESVDPEIGRLARATKVEGLLNAVSAAGPSLRRVLGIGSWAGRLGNRHQTHYAAANALLARVVTALPGLEGSVGEYGPWVGSAMAETIPAPLRAALRAEGVDFVGPQAGLTALTEDLGLTGTLLRGRRLPDRLVRHEVALHVSVDSDPWLRDHSIDGHPVLALAAAADLLAWASARPYPLSLDALTLYAGVVVDTPQELVLQVEGRRVDLRNADGRLHDRAQVGAAEDLPPLPPLTEGGDPPPLPLEAFYGGLTFHGPLLQGIRTLDALGATFVRGTVIAGRPSDWTPGTARTTYTIDPLALDSAFQLAAYAAWVRHRRAGTPVGLGRVVAFEALIPGTTYVAEAHFGEAQDDRFVADVVIRAEDGRPLIVVYGVVAELRKADAEAWTADPVTYDPSRWTEVQDLEMRLEGVGALGLRNPYFHLHEGTARDTTRVGGRELVNFSSYNYLGYSGDPRVLAEVEVAIHRYGTSVSASRVASGERPFHRELEAELAAAQGAEDAILYTAGHATNVGTIGHLFGPEDLILHDAYIHDSALQGIKLSGAARRWFRHEDPEHLAHELTKLRPHYRRCLIIVEGVYSMDGDLCSLPEYVRLKRQHGAMLMVDEAHSFGVVGKRGCGIGEHHGIDGREIDLWMGTLSKSLASCGGWIAGSKALIRYLRYTSPGFVYSAGLTPANGVAALASLRLMLQEPERVARIQSNAAFFHDRCVGHGLDLGPARGGSGVVPVITGNSMHALVLSGRLAEQGINVQPIVYPAVADDAARLRFFLSATHSTEQLAHTADTVAATLRAVRLEMPLP